MSKPIHERVSRLLRLEEAAELLNVSRTTLYEMLAERRIPYVQLHQGKRGRRISLAAIEAWIERNTVPAIVVVGRPKIVGSRGCA